ncbi:Putative aspartic peptidase A1 family, aspartic peptidase domain superfamily [Septoria linicola]|uniref:Aspartic peptidase A1 family, aspartic peptidase domain superfamily n=1 Tax=Septoria linicola TaxID=215465 RepID=A0A9Q9B528_9PEZI|nr:Putative aspartic peptidase A1 family, aspartic peptidase domain superfamily [Septoria linicola]
MVDVPPPNRNSKLIPGTSATAANVIWTITTEGCELANPDLDGDQCAFARGNTFKRNASLTWSTSRLENGGLYEVGLYEESKLGLSANAYYGFDNVSFGLPGSVLPKLENQIIAGIATNDFFLGTLALSPISQNFTSYTTGAIPSLLGTLRNQSLVPSTTWAYTSGAVYKSPRVFGSVTFGGYDANRIDMSGNKSVSVPFFTDPSRDLLLGLQSITHDTLGSSPLLTDGIYVFIDSLVAQMWLPLSVCQAFETAFGLEWDNVTELYTVSEQAHSSLLSQNPSFAFTVGASKDQGSRNTVINIPYAAFDLNVSTPYYNESRRYFPLKRAQNDTQYTLGRSFLQESYVIADYERGNFTTGQALFPATPDIVPILPPGLMVKRSSRIGAGATVGIVVGVCLLIAVILMFVIWRRKQRRRSYSPAPTDEKPPLPHEDETVYQKAEAGNNEIIELRGDAQYGWTTELPAKHVHR